MAVALDVLSGPGGTGTNGHMFSGSIANGTTGATVASFQNIGASATFLAVMVSINDSLANIGTMSVHWDSAGTNQNMTAINSANDPGGAISIWTFGLVNPTTGTKSIKITWSGGAAGDTYEILGASWTGTITSSVAAATEGAATANASTGNPSVTTAVSIPSGDAAFSGIVAGNALTIGTGTLNDVDGSAQNTLSARYSGAGSTISGTATQTSAAWAAAIFGIKAGTSTLFVFPFTQDIPLKPPINLDRARRQMDAFAFAERFTGVVVQSSIQWPWTNIQDVPQLPKKQRDVFLFHSPFVGTVVQSSIQWPWTNNLVNDQARVPYWFRPPAEPQPESIGFVRTPAVTSFIQFQSPERANKQANPREPPWNDYTWITNTYQTKVTQVYGGAFTNIQDTPVTPKQQRDVFLFHSPFVGVVVQSSIQWPWTNIQDNPQLPKKQWDQFTFFAQANLTPTAFSYQLQQDVPQLPKQQRDVFAFHSPFGLYVPSFSYQLQQDVPQLPKKQWDQVAFFAQFNLTPTAFGYQLQQDIPQLPKKDWSAFLNAPQSFITATPSAFGYQLQQDVPQLPKKDWSATTNPPLTFQTFYTFQLPQDVPQLPKKDWSTTQNAPQPFVVTGVFGGAFTSVQDAAPFKPKQQQDVLAWNSPFFGTLTPSAFAYQLQQDIPQLPKKDWSAFLLNGQSFVTATPSAFGYQLQQDVPQLPKQQKDVFAFHTPFGLYSPAFSYQLQQDIPQLPKKQLDVLAWHSPFVGTLTQSSFSYQLQLDIPFRPYQQRDLFAWQSLFTPQFQSPSAITMETPQLPKKDWSTTQNVPQNFVTVPPAFPWQLQQDVPQLPKKQWDLFTPTQPLTAATPSTFGSFTNHPDIPQLPKKQRDLFAWHSPFFGTRTPANMGAYFASYAQETAYPNYKTVLLFVNAFNGQIIVQATVRKIYSYITSSYIQ